MKKLIAFVMVGLLLLSFAGCGGSGGNSDGGQKKPLTIADDRSIFEMRITAPEGFTSIERYTDQDKDGGILERDLNFTLADGGKISYGCMRGQILSELTDISALETKEVNGVTYYIVERGDESAAFAQRENDLYAVQYTPAEEPEDAETEEDAEDTEAAATEETAGMDNALAAIRFEESETPAADDTALYALSLSLEGLTVAGSTVNVIATAEGEITEKSVIWKFGEDAVSPDFRIYTRVFRGKALADALKEGKEYETKTVGDREYSVLVTDDETPYEYYTQYGDDVYEIRNNGNNNGWFVDRTEESVAAFEKVLATVTFN